MAATWQAARTERHSPERFLWCWAIVPVLVLTVPGGKHHHYMLSCLAPWAMLSARGLMMLREWSLAWPTWLKSPASGSAFFGLPIAVAFGVAGPALGGPDLLPVVLAFFAGCLGVLLAIGLHQRKTWIAATTLFATFGSLYVCGLAHTAQYLDECRLDTVFFRDVKRRMDEEKIPVIVNADLGSMDVFRILFYLGDDARSVHNLTFLHDQSITEPSLFVLTRLKDRHQLESLGAVHLHQQASVTRQESSPLDRFGLFELTFRNDLPRLSAQQRISPMQAMDREPGPFLDATFRR
jgi:uncharacterized membrane protein YqaE (UPF0057 family)